MAGAIRALKSGDTAAKVYAGTQAGYDLAVSDLTTLGGIIEIGPGLVSTITPGTPPSNIVVLLIRDTSNAGLEVINGIMLVGSTFSYRMRDSAGTARSVLTALNTDVLRLSYMASGGLTITDQNGTVKATITGSRINLASGVDLAFNGGPGTSGQIPVSAGAAASPAWTSVVGVGPTATKNTFYPAPIFSRNGIETTQIGATPDGEWNGLSTFINGATGRSHQTQIVIPRDFNTLTSWELWWTSSGTSTTGVDWRFGLGKLTNGTDSTAVMALTNQTVAPPGVSDRTIVTTLSAPAVTLAAGDVYKMLIRRPGTDVNGDDMRLIGIKLTYT